MNTNLIHNILNIVGLIVGSILFYDWTALGVSPETAASWGSDEAREQNARALAVSLQRWSAIPTTVSSMLALPEPPSEEGL